MALSRPYRIEYFRNRKVVKVGHAATINGALRAMIKSVHLDKVAAWAEVSNGHGIVKATLARTYKTYTIRTIGR